MKIFLVVFIVAIGALFSSCGSIEDLGSIATTDYIKELYPLAIGNEWVVEVREFRPDASVLKIDTLHYLIGDTLVVNGHKAFQVFVNGEAKNVLYYDSTTDLYGLNSKTGLVLRHILHAPMTVGGSYDLKNSVSIIGTDTTINKEILTLTAQHASKTTPAGVFTDSCSVFEDVTLYGKSLAVDTTTMSISYYAPRVGNIYQEDYAWNTNQKYLQYQTTLLSYIVK
ncbi:MAG TPA: hypothetical protein VFO76_04245 [Candidatus Kapabacteria bacterium]|nr:hypothetical protein [Candidatus Kapabacteria bacterium]